MKYTPRKIGDWVNWKSQAQGCAKWKWGRVVAIIPAGERPTSIKGCGWPRNHESYIIEVPPKTGSKAKSKAYWPVVSLLIGDGEMPF